MEILILLRSGSVVRVQSKWIILIFTINALALHPGNSFAQQDPAANPPAAPATDAVDTAQPAESEHPPVQSSIPFAADETLYAGDDLITIVDTPLLTDDAGEIATLSEGTTLVVRQTHGNWVQVDFRHAEQPLSGWVERTHVSLISQDFAGVAHESIKDIPKRLAQLHASSEEHLSREDFLASLEPLSELLKIDPHSALAYYRRGYSRLMLGEEELAIEDFNNAIELEPAYQQAYLRRGDAEYSRGEYDRAIADYEIVLNANPHAAGAFYMRGRCQYAKGQYDAAIADYNAALAINPTDTWVIAHRGEANLAKSQFDPAIADFDKATQIDRTFDWAISRRGDVWLHGKQDLDRAIADYTFAHAVNPHNSWAVHQRGHCMELKKEFAQAAYDYAQAVAIAPGYWDYSANLAWLLSTCPEDSVRDGGKALELAANACELTEWANSFALGALAVANAEVGHFDKAVEYQRKAIEHQTAGYNVEVAKHLLEKFRAHQPHRDE